MSFQPSIMVWTVICFCILMLILKNLLFKPLLQVMDSRNEKIQAANKRKQDMEALVAEHNAQQQREKELAKETRIKEAKLKLEQLQSQSQKEIENAHRQCLADIEKYKDSITDERNKIVSSVAPSMETAAALLARNILLHRI